MTSNRSAAAAILCGALLSGDGVCAREEARDARSAAAPPASSMTVSPPASYLEFGTSGQAAALMAIARRIYRDAAGAPAESPVEIPETRGRPAGPRDEPPPPEWPEGPAGVVLCLKVKDRVRACEGGRTPPSPDLAAAISVLAERLPASRSRGRPRPVAARQQPDATLQAAFIVRVEPVVETARGKSLPMGIDAASAGFVVSGAAGEMVTLPGEARSVKAALKLARKAGVVGAGAAEPLVGWYTPVLIGGVPALSP